MLTSRLTYISNYDETLASHTKVDDNAPHDGIINCLREFEKHSTFCRNAVINTQRYDSFRRAVLKRTRTWYQGVFNHDADSTLSDELAFTLDFYPHAVSSSMIDWLIDDMPVSAEVFADRCIKNALPPCLNASSLPNTRSRYEPLPGASPLAHPLRLNSVQSCAFACFKAVK